MTFSSAAHSCDLMPPPPELSKHDNNSFKISEKWSIMAVSSPNDLFAALKAETVAEPRTPKESFGDDVVIDIQQYTNQPMMMHHIFGTSLVGAAKGRLKT